MNFNVFKIVLFRVIKKYKLTYIFQSHEIQTLLDYWSQLHLTIGCIIKRLKTSIIDYHVINELKYEDDDIEAMIHEFSSLIFSYLNKQIQYFIQRNNLNFLFNNNIIRLQPACEYQTLNDYIAVAQDLCSVQFLSSIMVVGFDWDKSIEGFEFWKNINNKYQTFFFIK